MKKAVRQERIRALYIRVSTEYQAEEGYSIGAQEERLKGYCTAMGWENYRLYIDGGFSGSNLDRPEIRRLIADAEEGCLQSVLVYKLDRLSRSQKDTLFLIEDVFLPHGVDFISLNESIDTSTPYGRAMIGILSAFAQLERENIYLRTRMGMLERVKQGYWMGGGKAPFGYDYDSEQGILVPNRDAETVRKIYDLYIKGYSPQKLADLFDLKYDRLVTLILTRRSNLGLIPYNGKEYPGRHEAIVSRETFELAQRKMRERSSGARATPRSAHLLTGIIYCGVCGARLRYVKWGKGVYKLVCYSRDASKAYMHRAEHCANEAVWADEVEKIVRNDLFQLSAKLEAPPEPGRSLDPLKELELRIRRLEGKLRRLYNLYAEDENDTLLSAIEENKKALAALRAEYEAEEESKTSSRQLTLLRERAAGIAESWELLSDLEKQTLVRDCIRRIEISNQKIEIFYTFTGKGEDSVA